MYPEGFRWTCCQRIGFRRGCTRSRHDPYSKHRSRWGKNPGMLKHLQGDFTGLDENCQEYELEDYEGVEGFKDCNAMDSDSEDENQDTKAGDEVKDAAEIEKSVEEAKAEFIKSWCAAMEGSKGSEGEQIGDGKDKAEVEEKIGGEEEDYGKV